MIIYYSLPKDAQKEFNSELDSIIIGRKPKPGQSIDLDLMQDDFVSHQHSRISYENGKYWIEDMCSANGTWLNDEKIQEKTLLTVEDKIRIGYTEIIVHMDTIDGNTDIEPIPDRNKTTVMSDAECATKISEIDEETKIRDDYDTTDFQPLGGATIVNAQKEMPDDENRYDLPAEETVADFSAGSLKNEMGSIEKASEDKPDLSYSQLKNFNEFCSSLEILKEFEELALILSQKLPLIVPNAQRGAILLSDEKCELHLKAHWPTGNHSAGKIWCQKAYDTREAVLWTHQDDTGNDETSSENSIYGYIQSAIYLPLIIRTKAIGAMYVDNDYTSKPFSLTDLELMKAVATQVTLFIHNQHQ